MHLLGAIQLPECQMVLSGGWAHLTKDSGPPSTCCQSTVVIFLGLINTGGNCYGEECCQSMGSAGAKLGDKKIFLEPAAVG